MDNLRVPENHATGASIESVHTDSVSAAAAGAAAGAVVGFIVEPGLGGVLGSIVGAALGGGLVAARRPAG